MGGGGGDIHAQIALSTQQGDALCTKDVQSAVDGGSLHICFFPKPSALEGGH